MKLIIACFLFIAFYSFASAQERSRLVWKKEVERTVDIRTAKNNTDGKNCRKIAEILLDAVKNGYITAYHSEEHIPFTWERLNRFLNPKPDSIKIIDSLTGNVTSKIWDQRRNADSVYIYRVIEEWTFNYLTNKITIDIKSITPAEAKHYLDGGLLGCIDEFTISYKDFCSALEFNKDLTETFNDALWESYFEPRKNASAAISHGKWIADATIKTDFKGSSEYTRSKYLRDLQKDTSLNYALLFCLESGSVDAWNMDKKPFAEPLTLKEIKALTTNKQKIDTLLPFQDGLGYLSTRIPYANFCAIIPSKYGYYIRNDHDFSAKHINAYKILEKWAFNPIEGVTEITIKGIAPICDIYGNTQNDYSAIVDRQPLLWLDYKDIIPIIEREMPYTPSSNFILHLWNQFFTDDTKPVLEQ